MKVVFTSCLVITLIVCGKGATQAATSDTAACPPAVPQNQMLSALLLQLLLSSAAQQPQLGGFAQPLLVSSMEQPRTTVVTSSVIRTVTELLSTGVPIWFRNERITKTLVSSTIREVTELVTLTSTLPAAVDVNALRTKRMAGIEAFLEPSIEEQSNDVFHDETVNLETVTNLDSQVEALLSKPEVQRAWNEFAKVLNEAIDSA